MLHNRPKSTCYLAEIFASRADGDEQRVVAQRLRTVTETLAGSGIRVRYLRSLFLANEETAFHLFEADEQEAVERALRDAGVEAERISPATAVSGEDSWREAQQ